MPPRIISKKDSKTIVFAGIFILLTIAFSSSQFQSYYDSSGIAPNTGEPKVYGRLALSRQEGTLSEGGLLGFCYDERYEIVGMPIDTGPHNNLAYQRNHYLNGTCPYYNPYESQPGMQGMLFSAIDRAFNPPPILFQIIPAALSALVIILLMAWITAYFGGAVGIMTLLSVFTLRWPLIYADNISLFMGAIYIPMVALLWHMRHEGKTPGAIVFSAMSIKFLLSGAEYVFASVVMAFIPLAFYAVKQKWPIKRIGKSALTIAAAIMLAGALSGELLIAQISTIDSVNGGIQHVIYTFNKRSVNINSVDLKPGYVKGLSVPLAVVLDKYLDIAAIKFGYVEVSFRALIAFFAVISLIALALHRKSGDIDLLALLAATWAGIIGPLSWFILCRGHASLHTFIDPIVWHMPFVLFGMALSAATLKKLAEAVASHENEKRRG